MILSPIRVVQKTILINRTDKDDRYVVTSHVNGKVNSAYPPMRLDEANLLVDKIVECELRVREAVSSQRFI